jgi:hypothetical protein
MIPGEMQGGAGDALPVCEPAQPGFMAQCRFLF